MINENGWLCQLDFEKIPNIDQEKDACIRELKKLKGAVYPCHSEWNKSFTFHPKTEQYGILKLWWNAPSGSTFIHTFSKEIFYG